MLGTVQSFEIPLPTHTHTFGNSPPPLCDRWLLLSPGFLPRVIKVAPACAVMISSYEYGKTFFQKLNMQRAQTVC